MKHPSQLNLDWHNPENVPLKEGYRFTLEEEKDDFIAGKITWNVVHQNGDPCITESVEGRGYEGSWINWTIVTKHPLPEKYFHLLLEPGDIEVGDEIVCRDWNGMLNQLSLYDRMSEYTGKRLIVKGRTGLGNIQTNNFTWPIESIIALHKKQPTDKGGDALCAAPATTAPREGLSVVPTMEQASHSPARTSDPSGEGHIEPWMDSLAGEVSEDLIVDQPLHKVKLDVISMIIQHYRSRDEGPKSTLLPFNIETALKQPERACWSDGVKPTIIMYDMLLHKVIADRRDGMEYKCEESGKCTDCFDLMLLPDTVTVTRWVNVYPNGMAIPGTREQCDLEAQRNRIACVPVYAEVPRDSQIARESEESK